jgi:hypothetical protein
MNAERMLALYEQVAEAPDAITRLRRFVLDLAVRGKLMPQDPGDEPASELLKRIAAERARLKIKNRIAPLHADEIPFLLPNGWAWSRIGDLCSKTGSGSTPRGGKEVYKPTGVPFLRSQNVYDDGLRLTDIACIAPQVHERMAGTKVLAADLLLNITGGSIGRCCRVPGRGFVGVGRVRGPRLAARDFEIEGRPALDILQAEYHRADADDPERSEYFVPVDWLHTVPEAEAIQELGMFGNQNTVCKPVTPGWRATVDQLKAHFRVG